MPFNKTDIEIKYENKTLKTVYNYKLLGIIIDSQFNFLEHSIYLNNKLNSTTYIFNNLNKNKFPQKIKKTIFDCYVNSLISYSAPYIFGINQTYFKKIDSTYSRLNKLSHNKFEIKKRELSCRIEDIILKFMTYIIENKRPYPIYNLIEPHLSKRKKNLFILYKKPIKKLTLLFNYLKLFNTNNPRS